MSNKTRFERLGVVRADLPTLLRESDVVTFHVTLTEETRGFIGARELASMKPSAILINTSRGAVVDLDALCDALETDGIAAAALDVLPEEPPHEAGSYPGAKATRCCCARI